MFFIAPRGLYWLLTSCKRYYYREEFEILRGHGKCLDCNEIRKNDSVSLQGVNDIRDYALSVTPENAAIVVGNP